MIIEITLAQNHIEQGIKMSYNDSNLPVTGQGGILMNNRKEFYIHIAIFIILEISFKILLG